MASFLKTQSDYQNRSISLPCRSHPSTNTIEVELNKLKSGDMSSSTQNAKKIVKNLSGLTDLLKCLEDLLKLQTTKQSLSHPQCEKFIHNLQDEFITLLDICGIARYFMSQVKENGRKTLISLRRRRKGDSIVSQNTCFRKKMMKDAKTLVFELRQMENKIGTNMPNSELDHHRSSVIRSLREVVAMSSIVFNSIYSFVCAPISKPKTRWSAVSKLMQKGAVVACENQIDDLNELQSLDIAFEQLYKSDDKKVHQAISSLKALEISIEDIEHKLEFLYRGLIKARANLLNISSSLL